jgi:hypothetical protein
MSTATTKEPVKTKVVTGKTRLSYVNLLEPAAVGDDQTKKYSVSVIIPKSDKETVSKIKKGIQAAIEAGKDSVFKGKIPAKLDTPLRDGDEDRPEDEAYANSWFINAKSTQKPGIVDKALNPILEADEVYSGMYGRVSINFFAYDKKGNKGIAAGLQNVQKLSDGEPLGGGRSKAEDDFADDIEDDDDL